MDNNQNIYYVYKHTFENGTCYIGKGKDNRAFNFKKRNIHWNRLRDKYGNPIVEILHNNKMEQDALDIEMEEIKTFKSKNIILCNITDGGDGCSGMIHSEETKMRLSEINQGKKHSIESKIKRSLALKGRVFTDEHKRKIGLKHKGKIFTEETKRKLSLSKTGKKQSDEFKKKRSDLTRGKNNPKFDHNEYYFIHNTFGVEKSTKYDLRMKYGLSKELNLVVSGIAKSHKGWRLAQMG